METYSMICFVHMLLYLLIVSDRNWCSYLPNQQSKNTLVCVELDWNLVSSSRDILDVE